MALPSPVSWGGHVSSTKRCTGNEWQEACLLAGAGFGSRFLPLNQVLENGKGGHGGGVSLGLVHMSLTGFKCDSAFNLIFNVVPIPHMGSIFLSQPFSPL